MATRTVRGVRVLLHGMRDRVAGAKVVTRKPLPSSERLVRTSVQIPPAIIARLDEWPGLTRSEALREALVRYFSATDDPAAAYLHPFEWARSVRREGA